MEILEHEQKPVTIADLIDIPVFKIALHKELLIIYINYPIIKTKDSKYFTLEQFPKSIGN